jgi:hypothetical protein
MNWKVFAGKFSYVVIVYEKSIIKSELKIARKAVIPSALGRIVC